MYCMFNPAILTTVKMIVINNTKYRHHTDPLFKRNNIVKVSDLYQLQVFSFMYDLVNNKLPGSFDDFIPITNESNYVIATRQCNRLLHDTTQDYIFFEFTKP